MKGKGYLELDNLGEFLLQEFGTVKSQVGQKDWTSCKDKWQGIVLVGRNRTLELDQIVEGQHDLNPFGSFDLIGSFVLNPLVQFLDRLQEHPF